MTDISAYINSAILKIPFNLFNIISEYIELNNSVKVAIVGGYIRDLLITKIHKKTFFNPLDIDIVTEGSSVDLAKFIKKSVSNVNTIDKMLHFLKSCLTVKMGGRGVPIHSHFPAIIGFFKFSCNRFLGWCFPNKT